MEHGNWVDSGATKWDPKINPCYFKPSELDLLFHVAETKPK